MVLLRSQRGPTPLTLHACLRVPSGSRSARLAEGRLPADCRSSEKEDGRSLKADGRARRRSSPRAGRDLGVAGKPPAGAGGRLLAPGRAALAAAWGPRSSFPRDFVPGAVDWAPCNIARRSLDRQPRGGE